MPSADKVSFPCLEVQQPIGTFYIGAIPAPALVAISYADVRRIKDRKIEEFTGIQRPLSSARIRELRQYVTTVDAAFPTSIILAVRRKDASFSRGRMTLSNSPKTAMIIDGQHRIAGLEEYEGPPFALNVTIFVDMDIEDQAMMFATINLKQTKVNKSLAYDLYEFATSRSPQKTCHNIAKLLNRKTGSPFKGKIKILGVASGEPHETIAQATFVDQLIRYISQDPMDDRDRLKRGRSVAEVGGARGERLIFREMFVGERDAAIAKNVSNYFTAVQERWPKAWPEKVEGNILNRSTGFIALMRFLRDAYCAHGKPDVVLTTNYYLKIFRKVKIKDNDFTPEHYNPGGSGVRELYSDLCEVL